jgi:hypothetical protein
VVRGALLLGVAAVALYASGAGCGSAVDSSSGLNAPCTRDKDCQDGLTCEEGVCTGPSVDAGGDASDASDAGLDAGGNG